MQKNQPLKLQDLMASFDRWAPFAWQESYDNSGLILGNPGQEAERGLVCLDLTLPVVEEAIGMGAQVVISHHPPIFKGLKRIDPENGIGKMLRLSLANNLSWIALHTNLDNVADGVNAYLCRAFGLQETRALVPLKGLYGKLETFVPEANLQDVARALSEAGCGQYRNYDSCSWHTRGQGRFRALENARPFVGEKGSLHTQDECLLQMLYPIHKTALVVEQLRQAHPYEEPAFHLLPLDNSWDDAGAGIVGDFPAPLSEKDFLERLKALTGAACIRHSGFQQRKIRRMALCGGSGAGFIPQARSQKADVYVTADLKYHDFADATPGTWLVDVGHFESEQFAKQLIYEHIRKNFPTFAVSISERSVNPVFCY